MKLEFDGRLREEKLDFDGLDEGRVLVMGWVGQGDIRWDLMDKCRTIQYFKGLRLSASLYYNNYPRPHHLKPTKQLWTQANTFPSVMGIEQ